MFHGKISLRNLILTAIMILAMINVAFGAAEKGRSHSALPQPDIPKPQFFCGYCHILTYPGIVQKSFDTWEQSKHNKIFCVQCHYPPKKNAKKGQAPWEGPKGDSIHIPKKPPEHFSYLPLGGETVRTKPAIPDASCVTASCHGRPKDPFRTKKIKITDRVSFVHRPHLEKKNQIEGQNINCTTCHAHVSELKHFEVSKDLCILCHFQNAKFNEGRGQCELCHALPEKPLQSSDAKPITHEMLKKANVSCGGCHYDVIKASGGGEFKVYFEGDQLKTAMVLGAGKIKKENCLACHDQEMEIKEAGNQALMHREHVTNKTARCFDCHRPIMHAKADLTKASPYGCSACHGDPHTVQRVLASGPKREGIAEQPDPMFRARTNCLGCHTEKGFNEKGRQVMRATSRSCVSCHGADYEKMFGMWTRELTQELTRAQRMEREAIDALNKHKAELDREKLSTASQMLKEGRENLGIVKRANGIHNAKYSIALLDKAVTNFKDMIAFVEGKESDEGPFMEE